MGPSQSETTFTAEWCVIASATMLTGSESTTSNAVTIPPASPTAVVSRPIKHVRPRGAQRLTARIGVLGATVRKLRSGSWGYLLMLVPVAAVVAALLAI